jgi:hypothetical protein
MLTLLAAVALAAVPAGVTPFLAPPEAPDQWLEYRASAKLSADPLACDTLWTEALVCFKITEGKKRRWVTAADLTAWGVDVDGLRAEMASRGRKFLETQPKPTPIDGVPGATMWVAAEGDGWSAAGILAPDAVASRLGSATFLVVTPTPDVVIAWLPGSNDADTIVAVGAKEMYDARDDGVTPVVHLWNGTRWSTFAQAVPKDPNGDAGAPPVPK